MEEAKILASASTDVSTEASTGARDERAQLVELVRRWGGCTTDAVLDPAMQVFMQPGITGFIGYRPTGRCAVVFGDPICAAEDKASLTEAFHRYADEEGMSLVYIAVSQTFAKWAIQHVCGALVEFGEELIFDPSCDPRKKSGTRASLVRRKVKQAIREGVVIEEYLTNDPELERAMERVGELWLKSRSGTQLHISDIYLFADRPGKRWFYAKRGDSIVGVVVINQLQSQNGWLLNHLMITPDAPNGTPELLMIAPMEVLEKEGCRHVTVGVVTPDQLGEIAGLDKFSAWLGRTVFKVANKAAHLNGLNTFWGKFHPQKSEPAYLLFSRKRIGLREIISLARALYGSL